MATEKPPTTPEDERSLQEEPQPPAPQTRPVAEREPLTVTVLDSTADTAVQAEAPVAIPQRVGWEIPMWVAPLLGLAAVLLFGVYRLQYAPLVLRFEHGIQRRVWGERDYDAHREPHAPQQVDHLGKWSADYHRSF